LGEEEVAAGLAPTTSWGGDASGVAAAGPRTGRRGGEGAAADWSAVYLRDVAGAGAGLAAAGFASFSLMMAAGRFVGDDTACLRVATSGRKDSA
jgi:hypothetical protein